MSSLKREERLYKPQITLLFRLLLVNIGHVMLCHEIPLSFGRMEPIELFPWN